MRKKNFTIPDFKINVYAGTTSQKIYSPHPHLYQQLKRVRDSICAKNDLPLYLVAGSGTLDEMARYLPLSEEDLARLSGFGEVKVKKYGIQFLEIILAYCEEKNLTSKMHELTPRQKRKKNEGSKKSRTNTKQDSFKLFKAGNSIDEIARARKLTVQTIEGHLAFYVLSGDINISEVLSAEKISLIEPVVRNYSGESVFEIKVRLGKEASYGEIKLVTAWVEYLKNQRPI